MTGLTLPNGITSSYSYGDAGRLELLTQATAAESLASYDYSLDKVGNRRILTETLTTVPNLPEGTFIESNGLIVMESEHGQWTAGLTHTWLQLTSQPGYTGTSYLQSSLDIDAPQTSEITDSPRVDYPIYVSNEESCTLWLRGYPPNAAGDSLYVGVNEVITSVTGFGPGQWSWSKM